MALYNEESFMSKGQDSKKKC